MKTHKLAHNLSLIDVAPPISGFEEFIGAYVLSDAETAIIDVGPSVSVANLISGLRELKINPADIGYILTTHIHMDHAGGVGEAIKQMPKARVVVHEKGGPHLVDPTRLWEDSQRALGQQALEYGPIAPLPQDRIIIAKNGMLLNLGETEIEVLETPGHASHHLSFLDRKEGRLFAGELAGVYIREVDLIRPTTPLPFNLEQALTSLDRLIQLGPTSLCYGHFGSATEALDRLRYAKQQLLLWGSIIVGCLEKEASPQDMYDALRQKDEMLARVDNLSADQRDRELYFIDSSIAGLVGYFKRYGTEYIKRLS